LTALRGELREMGELIKSRLTLLSQQQQSVQPEAASTSDQQRGSQTRQLLTDLEQELRQSEER